MEVIEIVFMASIVVLLSFIAYLLWRDVRFRENVIDVVLQSDRLNTYFYALFSDAKKLAEEHKKQLKADIIAELSVKMRQV